MSATSETSELRRVCIGFVLLISCAQSTGQIMVRAAERKAVKLEGFLNKQNPHRVSKSTKRRWFCLRGEIVRRDFIWLVTVLSILTINSFHTMRNRKIQNLLESSPSHKWSGYMA